MTTTRRVGSAAALALLLATIGVNLQGSNVVWNVGDVLVGVGNGSYKVYSNTGVFKDTITTSTDLTAGCAFNSLFDVYTTNSTNTKVFKFDGDAPHAVLQTIDTNDQSAAGHSRSIVFDAAGNFYVGHADSDDVLKYDAAGNFLTKFDVPIDLSGSDWIDLSTDQKTLFYTSEGTLVKRFDLAASGGGAPLPDFSSALTKGFALRLLGPSFNGSNGLIVANNANIRRLNSSGAIVQTYDASGQQEWQTLALDPNGTSFWAGDSKGRKVYKFNFNSSSPVLGPISIGGGNFTLGGICVLGQQQLNTIPLVYTTGLNVKRTAQWGDSAGTAFHTWSGTFDQVNQQFTLVISATEGVDPARLHPTFCSTVDCSASTDASPIPYSNGNPIVYRIFNPPAATAHTGNILHYIGFHQPSSYTPPTCIASADGNPRLLRAPSTVVDGVVIHGTDFIFDATTFVNKFGQFGDPIGGGTKSPNDYLVADRCPETAGAQAIITSPDNGDSVNEGSAISLRVEVSDQSGPITDANDFPNDMTLTVADPQGVIILQTISPGNSPSVFADKGIGKYGAQVDTNGFQNGTHSICVTSIDESGTAEIGTSTGPGQFPPVCVQVNITGNP